MITKSVLDIPLIFPFANYHIPTIILFIIRKPISKDIIIIFNFHYGTSGKYIQCVTSKLLLIKFQHSRYVEYQPIEMCGIFFSEKIKQYNSFSGNSSETFFHSLIWLLRQIHPMSYIIKCMLPYFLRNKIIFFNIW